jgi:hypothetical protein
MEAEMFDVPVSQFFGIRRGDRQMLHTLEHKK